MNPQRLAKLVAIVSAVVLHLVVTVFAALSTDLIEVLPGQPSVSFKQYAGYVSIGDGKELFYYFVEAETDPSSKPLTLWLNGGPGCSSIGGGAFTELGPFYPDGSATRLVNNPYSWNKASNLLFVESPVGVGWSYSSERLPELYDDEKTAQESVQFLLKWFKKFPKYRSRDFFITGESYAGHYIPQLVEKLLDYNTRHSHTFNLKGIAIGNPALNQTADTLATYQYYWSHGLISDEVYEGLSSTCDWDDYNAMASNATCSYYLHEADNEVGPGINPYDVLLDVCLSPSIQQELRLKQLTMRKQQQQDFTLDICIDNEIDMYLNRMEVQEALHANITKLPYAWSECDGPVLYTGADLSIDMVPILKDLLSKGLRIWIFSGDADSVVPFIGTRLLVDGLAADMNLRATSPYRPWFQDNQVAGWMKNYENLTFATVRGAAHMVPYAQPARALLLFQTFLSGENLPNSTSISINQT